MSSEVDDVKSIFEEMSQECVVESELRIDLRGERLAKEKIKRISERLGSYSLKALYVAFKESMSERPVMATKDDLILYITNYFVDNVHTLMVDHVPTGVVLQIDQSDFYEKLEMLIKSKDGISIEENLRNHGIQFTRSDTLFIGPMG